MSQMTGMGERAGGDSPEVSVWLEEQGAISDTAPFSQTPYLNTERLSCQPYEDDCTHLFPFHFLKSEIPTLPPHS